ncbi:MAG: DUF4097 family beta strand repeat-containing protein [Eubacteriales bacterium]|nr:DUF4097 family beta strand repeat-containing protein [Eubacteriales bacterium]MDD4106154.1 DUF4097 family beta strand repeat-containing protein [Eubacteriales bacterium]MDD4711508.1 DUF4097 family beta strand repeat-containing protein [Eubacteriales bacterium]NLO14589.1 DUF4097 domain-containing protein [Clostridiales bacterium]
MKRIDSPLKMAGVMLAAGLVLLSGMRAASARELVYDKKDYTVSAAGIQEIRIKARNMPLEVTAVQGDEILINYYTSDEDPYEVSLDGGVLTLKYKNDDFFGISSWFSGALNVIDNTNPKVQVFVPQAYAGMFMLDTSNASVNMSDLTQSGDVHIETSNGRIEVKNVAAPLVEAHTSNGAVTLDEVSVSGAIDMKSSNGALTAGAVNARDKLRMETSNGRIVLDRVISADIELRTSNGSVSGSVEGRRGDFTIASDTSNGDDNLGDGGNGQKRLTVHTSNGNIDISFLDE